MHARLVVLVVRGGWGRYFLNPNNDFLRTCGFSVDTQIVNSLDNGADGDSESDRQPVSSYRRPRARLIGAATFLGRAFIYANMDFKLPYVDQFSFGLQYKLPWRSKVEASYVGSRTRNMQTSRPLNTYDYAFRQLCDLAEGGNPAYCDQQLPNPFCGLEPFRGTSLDTSNTLTRSTLARPFPHFGTITELVRNDGSISYNSLQLSVETRSQHGLNVLASYTLSKMIEQNGYVQRDILQRSLYLYDRPHRFTVASIHELSFGQGKRFLNTSHPIWKRLIGW